MASNTAPIVDVEVYEMLGLIALRNRLDAHLDYVDEDRSLEDLASIDDFRCALIAELDRSRDRLSEIAPTDTRTACVMLLCACGDLRHGDPGEMNRARRLVDRAVSHLVDERLVHPELASFLSWQRLAYRQPGAA